MKADSGREAPGETALRARGRRGTATLVVRTAVVAALAGLSGGLVVGWWVGRHALDRPSVVVAPVASPSPVQPTSLTPPPGPVARVASTGLKRPPRRRAHPPHVAPLPPQTAPVTKISPPWWSDIVNDNPYR
jgi:hypothetical protein